MPGFETLDDGSTRLFVDLSETVPYETKTAKGSTTYVLRGLMSRGEITATRSQPSSSTRP